MTSTLGIRRHPHPTQTKAYIPCVCKVISYNITPGTQSRIARLIRSKKYPVHVFDDRIVIQRATEQ
jgi:hypothetical protein